LFDDLNAPEALAALFTFSKRANAALDRNGTDAASLAAARSVFGEMDGVLDLVTEAAAADPMLSATVERLLGERRAARQARDFPRADAIRTELKRMGVEIDDGPEGTKWRLAN
jgi:cysteinyl-tRNA synthetase